MKRRQDSRQLTIDWTAAAAPAPATPVPPPLPSVPAFPEPPAVAPAVDVQSPIQVLPWDFTTTFPPVLPDAIEAGILSEYDADPENLAMLHEEHGNVMLAALVDIDTMHDARRRGIDPATGKAPQSGNKKVELPARLTHEIARLERWWQTLLDTYEAGFGAIAAEAFGKYIRARHAGIGIVAQPAYAEPPAVVPTLPNPRPLPASVTAGVFGQDEAGPVDPSEDEIYDITNNHAELVIELFEIFHAASQHDPARATRQTIDEAIQKYADDFGPSAGEALLAYCHRRALLNRSDRLALRPPSPTLPG